MLVIRRRLGESLLIGDEIEVQVLEATSSQVKLGIRAPKSIGVVRSEIKKVEQQNQAAARPIQESGLKKLLTQFKPD